MKELIVENLTHLQSNHKEWSETDWNEREFDMDGFIEDVFLWGMELFVCGERAYMNSIHGQMDFNDPENEEYLTYTLFDVVCESVEHYIHGIWTLEDFIDEDQEETDELEEMLENERHSLSTRLDIFKRLYNEEISETNVTRVGRLL